MLDTEEILRLSRVAASKCFIADPAIDRDDLTQIAALEIIRHPEVKPAFLVIKARDRIRDLRRSNQVKRRLEQDNLPVNYHVPDRRRHVLEIAEDEERESVRNCPALTKQQRLIISKMLDGWTPAEISNIHGIPLNGISNQISMAVRRLQDHFGLPKSAGVRLGRCKAARA